MHSEKSFEIKSIFMKYYLKAGNLAKSLNGKLILFL